MRDIDRHGPCGVWSTTQLEVKRQWLAGLHPWWILGNFSSSPAIESCLAGTGCEIVFPPVLCNTTNMHQLCRVKRPFSTHLDAFGFIEYFIWFVAEGNHGEPFD